MKGQKACKKCKILVEGDQCPICQGNSFTDSWKGKVIIFDSEKSEIAKHLKIKQQGSYAVKV